MSGTAQAAAKQWTGATADMNDAANWTPNGVPTTGDQMLFDGGSAFNTVTFSTGFGTGGLGTVSLPGILMNQATDVQVNHTGASTVLRIAGTTASTVVQIESTAGNLTLGDGAGASTAFVLAANAPTSAVNFTFLNNSPTSVGTLESDVTLAGGGNNPTANWIFDGVGNWSIKGVIGTGTTSDSISVIKNGVGTLTLAGANTYKSATSINAGTLKLSNSLALQSSIYSGGLGSLVFDSTVATHAFTFGSLNASTNLVLEDDAINAVALTVGSNTTPATYSGALSGTGSLTKVGSGTQTLSGTNTYAGVTTINSGALVFGRTASLYNNTPTSWTPANISVASGATLGLGLGDSASGYFDVTALDTLLDGSHLGASTTTTGLKTGAILGFDTTNATGGLFTYGSVIADHTGGSVLNLTKLGAGTLTLGGANTYTGTTTVSAGTLQIGSSERLADTGIVNVTGGTFDLQGFSETIGQITTLTNGTISGTSGNKLILTAAGNTTTATGANTISADLQLNTGTALTRTFSVTNSNETLTISGAASQGAAVGSVTKAGVGTLVLSGTNTYTGPTTITAGTLSVGAASNLGGAPSDLIFNGGNLQITGTTLNNFTSLGHSASFTATKLVGLDINNAANVFTVDQVLNQTTGGFTKLGAGTAVLNLANTYTGATTVGAGALNLQSNSALGTGVGATTSAVSVTSGGALQLQGGISTTTAVALTLNGGGLASKGALENVGGVNTYTGLITLGSASSVGSTTGTLNLTHTGTITGATAGLGLTLTGAGDGNLASIIGTGTGGLNKGGSGTWILTGVNTYTGNTTLSGGVLQTALTGGGLPSTSILQLRGGVIQSNGTFSRTVGTAAGNVNIGSLAVNPIGGGYAAKGGVLIIQLNGGTASQVWAASGSSFMNSGQSLIFGSSTADDLVDFQNAINLGSSGTNTRTVTVLDNPSLSTDRARISGALTNTAAGQSLLKDGAGILELTNANTYTGATTVNAGTLLANNATGSAAGTGSVTVKSTATFGGTGAVTGAVVLESGAILAPGASIESLATGELTLPSGATLTAEIDSSGSPSADVVTVTGNVTLGGALTVTDIAGVPAAVALGTKLTLIAYTGSLTGTFSGKAEGSTFAVGSNTFKIRYTDSGAVTLEAVAGVGGYSTWADTNAPSQTASQDFDNDGVPNAIEYVLGGLAATKDLGKLPTLTTPGGNLVFTFLRDQVSKTVDTGVFIDVGTTLTAWPSTYTVGNNTAGSTTGVTVTDNLNGTDTVTLTIPRAPDDKKFARLRVEISP
ncbi:autotransporter-associated beta strand repeat-containing protein [Luteolibacter arcticus]|uniref:Autotransporter-associated beta strand repeat-containing protein n=1 Tax=Luteolibacter arcticus TaxID=1581411 RepID=A0ABT3GK66_9BACT|nr:autotransporter-associated beta strand repeat-containing protein [Luteolibacter arcticus]MCW1923909.1 autotransporter-associated beta strand repeat-containing protein [Luteolibacter arcticus]